MGFYAYCVVRADHPRPVDIAGIDGSPVAAHELGDLAVWLSRTDRPQAGVDAASRHNRVVEAAVTDEVTPVPMRFGQWAAQLDTLEAAIAEKRDWYLERLRAFRGALEFGVRVVSAPKPPSAQVLRGEKLVTGAEYMNALRERAAAAQAEREDVERVTAVVAAALGPYARETRFEQPRTTHGLINVVHLVSRDRFDAYRAEAETLRARLPEMHLLLSGPWVPYSFAV